MLDARFDPSISSRGMALPTVLILLLVMAMIALSGLDDSILQERMAGNTRDRELAFQAAEAALRSGELWLQTNQAVASVNEPMDGVTARAWNGTTPPPSGSAIPLYDGSSELSLAANPNFFVARQTLIRTNPGETPAVFREIFPVVARGVGGTAQSIVIVRSTFEPL